MAATMASRNERIAEDCAVSIKFQARIPMREIDRTGSPVRP